jgi:hypothetical protein
MASPRAAASQSLRAAATRSPGAAATHYSGVAATRSLGGVMAEHAEEGSMESPSWSPHLAV